MTKNFTYQTQGTCSKEIKFTLEDNIVRNVFFLGGCNGNLQGISKLIEGMPAETVIEKLKGINCNGKGTSCPDQLTQALALAMKE